VGRHRVTGGDSERERASNEGRHSCRPRFTAIVPSAGLLGDHRGTAHFGHLGPTPVGPGTTDEGGAFLSHSFVVRVRPGTPNEPTPVPIDPPIGKQGPLPHAACRPLEALAVTIAQLEAQEIEPGPAAQVAQRIRSATAARPRLSPGPIPGRRPSASCSRRCLVGPLISTPARSSRIAWPRLSPERRTEFHGLAADDSARAPPL
jgi:hypothetical protein